MDRLYKSDVSGAVGSYSAPSEAKLATTSSLLSRGWTLLRVRLDWPHLRASISKLIGEVLSMPHGDQLHNSIAQFRMPDGLLAAAEARARRKGISLSELLRVALRKEVGGEA